MTTATKLDREIKKLNCLTKLVVKNFGYSIEVAEDTLKVLLALKSCYARLISTDPYPELQSTHDHLNHSEISYDNFYTICIWIDLFSLYANGDFHMGYDDSLKYAIAVFNFSENRYSFYSDIDLCCIELIQLPMQYDNAGLNVPDMLSYNQTLFIFKQFLPKMNTVFNICQLCEDIRNSDYVWNRSFSTSFNAIDYLLDNGYFLDSNKDHAILPK